MRNLLILWLILYPSLALAIDLQGHSEFARRVDLNSSLSGRIATLRVEVGQRVSAGEVVVTLVSTGLEAAVAQARAEIEALRPPVARALIELEKAQELYARDSLAQVELEFAEQDYSAAGARLAAAEAKLENALYRLSQAEIRSPIDGVVVEVAARVGVFVNTRVDNRPLLAIADIDTMIAAAPLPLSAADASLPGREASVRYDGQDYPGKIIEVGRQAALQDNGEPAVIVKVAFPGGGWRAAGVPVTVTLPDN